MPLRIQLTCPAPAGSTLGNRVTAQRWVGILRGLGHRVRVDEDLQGAPELLVALHARKSGAAAAEFKRRFPDRPLVVALTGTDIYADLRSRNARARRSLSLADRLVALNAASLRSLARADRGKTRVIHQSVTLPSRLGHPPEDRFDVCVLAHLRRVKDPLRAALASRRAGPESRLRVLHLGRALDERLAERARREMERNPRYLWLGERPRAETLRRLSRSHLLVLSSRMEGGANAIGEAAALGVGVLASDIEGNRGLLGPRHPGSFAVGDTRGLAALLRRAEAEPAFLRRLRARSERIAPLFAPERERAAWAELLAELTR